MLDRLRLELALRRNRLIGSQAMRRVVRWFPPARVPARLYARRLFNLTAGFVYSQILHALVTSRLLERLGEGPISLAEAARTSGLNEAAAATLLQACASLDLVEQHGEFWLLGPLGAALAASPGVSSMIDHHRLLYGELADPLAMLGGKDATSLSRLWHYGSHADPVDVRTYSALMAAMQPLVAEQALAAYDFRRHRALLDVGGGSGGFLTEICRRAPLLKLGLVDRPAVLEAARNCLLPAITCHPGDFFDDPLPTGYDLISLVRVLHDHDDEPASRLLASIRRALPENGTLLIVEPLAGTAGAKAMGHGYFGMYLAAMRSGRPRSFAEYRTMLRKVGFSDVRLRATPLPLIASVISADR